MTILTAGVWADCALLAIDTLGTDIQIEPGRPLKMSKLNVIPHARFAFAVRGVQTYGSVLHWLLNNPRPVEDFDDLLQNLEAVLSSLQTNVVTAAKQQGVNLIYQQYGQPAIGVELVLVGWSASSGRMVGRICSMTDLSADQAQFSVNAFEGWLLAPSVAGCSQSTEEDRTDFVLRSAQAQLAYLNSIGPNLAGGELLRLEMTKDRVVLDQTVSLSRRDASLME